MKSIISILCILVFVSSAYAETVSVQVAGGATLKTGYLLSLVAIKGDSVNVVKLTTDRGDNTFFCVFADTVKAADVSLVKYDRTNIPATAVRNTITRVFVTDSGGNISAGDLLNASATSGMAECQTVSNLRTLTDDIVRYKTVGKALEAIDWKTVTPDEDGIKKKLIWCIVR